MGGKIMAPGKKPDDEVTKFIRELRNAPSKETALYGMVKAAADDDAILFAPPGDCEHWAYIPKKAIKKIEKAGRSPCGGHFHDLARIQLKAPASEIEKAYASVAHLHRTKLAKASTRAASGGPPKDFPCKHWVWDNNSLGWICQD
jgi:hypothetical protein